MWLTLALRFQVVNRILDSLDQWRLRVAYLDLQLLCRQLGSANSGAGTVEMNAFLDAAARAVIDIFELGQADGSGRDDAEFSGSALVRYAIEDFCFLRFNKNEIVQENIE